jgi:hypothetical protein
MAEVAFVFHFPPSELWDMDVDEILMWHEQAKRINEQLKT